MRSLRRIPSLRTGRRVAKTAASAHAQLVAVPYIDTNFAGAVETGRGGIGASVAYYHRGRLGVELDVEFHPHFFDDDNLVGPRSAGVDLNTSAALFMGNFVVPFRVGGGATGMWRPYGTAGLGVILEMFDSTHRAGTGQQEGVPDQKNVAFNIGAGVMHKLTGLVGFRVNVRYFHVFVNEDAIEGGYFQDYDFFRVSVGVTFGFPR